jgi:chromosome partitioning protein
MKIITLAQGKGGVGKSSAAINLACEAVRRGESATILDMDDGQWSADAWGKRRKSGQPAVMRVEPFKLAPTIARLREEGCAWVFIDLPGRNTPAANAGLAASDFVLIPARPVALDAEASVGTVQSCIRAKRPYAYLISIAPAQHDKARARRFADDLKEAGQPVCPVILIQRVIVPDAIADGRCTCEAEPGGASAAEFTALFSWLMENPK